VGPLQERVKLLPALTGGGLRAAGSGDRLVRDQRAGSQHLGQPLLLLQI
jgi:hypothetical protein